MGQRQEGCPIYCRGGQALRESSSSKSPCGARKRFSVIDRQSNPIYISIYLIDSFVVCYTYIDCYIECCIVCGFHKRVKQLTVLHVLHLTSQLGVTVNMPSVGQTQQRCPIDCRGGPALRENSSSKSPHGARNWLNKNCDIGL